MNTQELLIEDEPIYLGVEESSDCNAGGVVLFIVFVVAVVVIVVSQIK